MRGKRTAIKKGEERDGSVFQNQKDGEGDWNTGDFERLKNTISIRQNGTGTLSASTVFMLQALRQTNLQRLYQTKYTTETDQSAEVVSNKINKTHTNLWRL